MSSFRTARLRFYPTFVMIVLLAQRALALDGFTPGPEVASATGSAAQWRGAELAINEGEPELDVITDEFAIPGVRFHLEVDPQQRVRDVYAYMPGVAARKVKLQLHKPSGRYRGDLPVPELLEAEELTIRIVTHDLAHSRMQYDLHVPVFSDVDAVDEDETCGLTPAHVLLARGPAPMR